MCCVNSIHRVYKTSLGHRVTLSFPDKNVLCFKNFFDLVTFMEIIELTGEPAKITKVYLIFQPIKNKFSSKRF